jgi:hypothetical protein
MKKRLPYLILIAIITLFALSGCINLYQDITVNEDGSGLLWFATSVETETYDAVQEHIPQNFQLESLLATLMQNENVVNVTTDHYDANGRTWDTVELEVTDVAALLQEDRRIGLVMLSLKEDNGTYSFAEILDIENTNLAIPGVNLMDLTGAGYTVTFNAPQITGTNGLQTGAGTATWDVPLSDLLQGGETIVLEADYALTPYEGTFIPWGTFFPYVVMGFLGLGVVSILVVIVVNTTKGKEKKQKIDFDI